MVVSTTEFVCVYRTRVKSNFGSQLISAFYRTDNTYTDKKAHIFIGKNLCEIPHNIHVSTHKQNPLRITHEVYKSNEKYVCFTHNVYVSHRKYTAKKSEFYTSRKKSPRLILSLNWHKQPHCLQACIQHWKFMWYHA